MSDTDAAGAAGQEQPPTADRLAEAIQDSRAEQGHDAPEPDTLEGFIDPTEQTESSRPPA